MILIFLDETVVKMKTDIAYNANVLKNIGLHGTHVEIIRKIIFNNKILTYEQTRYLIICLSSNDGMMKYSVTHIRW